MNNTLNKPLQNTLKQKHLQKWFLIVKCNLADKSHSSSSLTDVFSKKVVLKNFGKFTGNYLSYRTFSSSRPEVFCKKGVLRNLTNSQENICARASFFNLFFNKVAGLRPATLLEKRLWHWCFHVNFAKSLRTPFFTENLWETASYAIIILLKRTTTCYSWGCLLVIRCKERRTEINFWTSIWTAPRKSMNKDIWVVGTSRQIFKRGSYTETKFSRK